MFPNGRRRAEGFFAFFPEDEFEPQYEQAEGQIVQNFNSFNKEGSNCVVDIIKLLELKICQNTPFAARSYISLPQWIARKKAVIKIQNINDNNCFAEENAHRVGNISRLKTS